jgi:hypothetical protein
MKYQKCCAEIGGARHGWHPCGRKATVLLDRAFIGGNFLGTFPYCERHAKEVSEKSLPSIHTVKTYSI